MAGIRTDKEKLNHTLEVVVNILHKENINDWFIFFGTLLGIVRENSCIQGDDDLDIMINCDYQKLHSVFEEKGFGFLYYRHECRPYKGLLLKSQPTTEFASFDFYICNVNESGDFHTPWHGVIATNSYIDINNKSLIKFPWNNTTLNMPNNYEQKLVNMYGDWKTRRPRARGCKAHIGKV